MTFIHENAEATLAALTTDATDESITAALAQYLVVGRRLPITLSVNHNAKVAPCPLKIDRPGAKICSVKIDNADRALTWVIEALTRGYEVSTMTHKGHETRSVALQRSLIEHQARMAEWRAKGSVDDDIPF